MIVPAPGVAFTLAEDGDVRRSGAERSVVSTQLGVNPEWATVEQVHGDDVVVVDRPGPAGQADALVTRRRGLVLAVFTADCLGVVVMGDGGVGVAHAGWRGMAAQVLARTVDTMRGLGIDPTAAYAGPAIGPCCFEVGVEVASRFPGNTSFTSWDSISVDLAGAARRQLDPIPLWDAGRCTSHQAGLHSYRGSGTPDRMAALGWIPEIRPAHEQRAER